MKIRMFVSCIAFFNWPRVAADAAARRPCLVLDEYGADLTLKI